MRYIIKFIVSFAPLHFLVAAVTCLGWDVALKNTDDNEVLEGLIVGTEEFIKGYIGDD